MVLPLYLQKKIEVKKVVVEKEIVFKKQEVEKEIVVKKKVVKKIEEEDDDYEEPTKIYKNLSRSLIKK